MLDTSRKPAEAGQQRIGALAKLPVFLDLHGKRAVVVGDTPGAAWKAELLTAAGAEVVCISNGWQAEDLTGAVLAVIDAADATEAAAFHAAAKAAGAICSAIDKP
jgi:uroporphyrin-III C-methyltransferase/precorrin-2 dehydrogenase/sirohydrochlorin ferrochelatase